MYKRVWEEEMERENVIINYNPQTKRKEGRQGWAYEMAQQAKICATQRSKPDGLGVIPRTHVKSGKGERLYRIVH